MNEWKDVIKSKRKRRKSPEPFNPFTGEGTKESKPETEAEWRAKVSSEEKQKREERLEKIKESRRKHIRAKTVSGFKGGTGKPSATAGISRDLTPTTRCAMCSRGLTIADEKDRVKSYKRKTTKDAKEETKRLTYCYTCAKEIGLDKFEVFDRPNTHEIEEALKIRRESIKRKKKEEEDK